MYAAQCDYRFGKKGVANYMDSDISNQMNNLFSDLAVSVRNNKTSRAAENTRSNLSIFFFQ